MKGLDYAEAHYLFLDKTRECALGASYGGFNGGLGADPHQPVPVHRDPRRHVRPGERVWNDRGDVVQRVGVSGRPEDFPKGWDGFSTSYDPMGHPTEPTHPTPPAKLAGTPVAIRPR